MKKIFLISLIFLHSIFFCLEAAPFWIWTPKTKEFVNPKYAAKDTPEEQFKWAMRFFKNKDYKHSAEEFTRLVTHFKDSDLAPEAQYYAGRSYQEGGKFYPAFESYQKTIEAYPFTKRINEIIKREYNLGIMLYKKHRGKLMGKELMTDLDRAIEIFKKVKENAPFGEYAPQAQFMIGRCYKKYELYAESAKAFQELVDGYPHSTLADEAKYEQAQSTLLASLKPDYDQELTDEAIKEFKKIVETTEDLPISEKMKLTVSLLEDKKAESIFNTAKFYERQKYYKSAAIYYQELLEKYPGNSFSELARERLEDISKFIKED